MTEPNDGVKTCDLRYFIYIYIYKVTIKAVSRGKFRRELGNGSDVILLINNIY